MNNYLKEISEAAREAFPDCLKIVSNAKFIRIFVDEEIIIDITFDSDSVGTPEYDYIFINKYIISFDSVFLDRIKMYEGHVPASKDLKVIFKYWKEIGG